MDVVAELGRNPVSKHQIQPEYGRDGTAEPVSRDQILRRERGQGNIHFSCPADHVQDWQPYPVNPYYSCYMCDHTAFNDWGEEGMHKNCPRFGRGRHKNSPSGGFI